MSDSEFAEDFISIEGALWMGILPYLIYLDDNKESIDLKRNRISIQSGSLQVIPVRLDFVRLYNNQQLKIGADLQHYDFTRKENLVYRVYINS